ncbi:unnamed protein product [marine sediment metagenome]|uniref:Uncharacterized protein n=1 Tax=marine sediment metagenome TaxID=412755 RepID=X1RT92_9ZZZZ
MAQDRQPAQEVPEMVGGEAILGDRGPALEVKLGENAAPANK